jgi:hypothetical protein
VPADSVSAVAANQVFVEAFLVGMNHEMSREMLWRRYPTDQRGTVFRCFWDERTTAAAPLGDITSMHLWPPHSELGEHPARAGSSGDRFVLVVRGELLRRFPRASVLLVPATLKHGIPRPQPIDATARPPIFSGRLDPDVTFLGFDVPATEVRGDLPPTPARPGWFLVMQEQPTEPRFGVSAASGTLVSGRYTTWADLGAGDLITVTGDGAGPVGYLDLAATSTSPSFLAKTPRAAPPPAEPLPEWDGRSDTLAAIFLRRPFRLYLHGSDILSGEVTS